MAYTDPRGLVWTMFADRDNRADAACRAALRRAYRQGASCLYGDNPSLEQWALRNPGVGARILSALGAAAVAEYVAGQEDTPKGRKACQRHDWRQEDLERFAKLYGLTVDWPGLHPCYRHRGKTRDYFTPYSALGVREA